MKMETDLFIDFMENNTKDVIEFCNTIELKNIENEIDELNEKLIETLSKSPKRMAMAIIALLGILAREKVNENENLELNGYKKFKKYLEDMHEYINDELESK